MWPVTPSRGYRWGSRAAWQAGCFCEAQQAAGDRASPAPQICHTSNILTPHLSLLR